MHARTDPAEQQASPPIHHIAGLSYPAPAVRKLRVYAFDPQASIELDTSVINDAVISLPWETPWEEPLTLGPSNEYLEVIDYDPTNGLFYAPVDLNDPILLVQDGLTPSEGRPQFHQQMVFAVAMKTIGLFERALGRAVMWALEPAKETEAQKAARKAAGLPHPRDKFIRRLRIYPHALREANAYYSPAKTALLFGYFRKGDEGEESYDKDSGWVFTCLSQDIVAHETAHAILHGMQRRSIEATSPDSLAFHEAFADIVALFQHFTMTDVVAHQIAHSRGSLRGQGLLNGLAQQFGHATGRSGALRYALETIGREAKAAADAENGSGESAARAKRRDPPPTLSETLEPHARGGFLVAAVFDAFVTIYERRTADLLRLAIGGSRPDGRELPPDLVQRLAREAGKAADHILRMCVRGLDYLPPVDVRFGEYLRAIITADTDLVPDDPMRYRVAVSEAFRNRGIYVPGCVSMAPDSLQWDKPDPSEYLPLTEEEVSAGFAHLLPDLRLTLMFEPPIGSGRRRMNLREESHNVILHNQRAIHRWLVQPSECDAAWEKLLGIVLSSNPECRTIASRRGEPLVEVHSARIARRTGPDGQELSQLIIQVTQRRRGYFDPEVQKAADAGKHQSHGADGEPHEPDFWFRGGCTIHADLRDGRLRRVMRKRIDDNVRLERERQFRAGRAGRRLGMTDQAEPFAMIHRG
ncbi:MAG TPA: hypothetical protein VN231_15070 [Allosphingosinicella sp.]|nr:hypothetical protein [Allosphingosinicella sp.]